MNRLAALGLLAALAAAAGCTSPATVLRAESLGTDPVYFEGDYVTAIYTGGDGTETSFYLADVPVERLLAGPIRNGNVVHIDLLWRPSAGNTPMDSSATNASIRYVIFAEGEVGVYGGAGFAIPLGDIGDETMGLVLEDGSLTLLGSTDGFTDLLSPAQLTGRLTATLDKRRAQQVLYAVSQMVTNALGRSMLVRRPTK